VRHFDDCFCKSNVEATAVAKSNVEATAVAKSNVEATAVAKSNVDEQTPQSSSTRRAALQEIRRELADLSQ